jgi:ParB-like chromosome segregation protein Spo0J
MARAGSLFSIRNGVRRAKAFQLAGLTQIPAEIFDLSSGRQIGSDVLSIDQLRSPKDELDLTVSSIQRWRFERLEAVVAAGQQHQLPAIEVYPGNWGVRIEDIKVIR